MAEALMSDGRKRLGELFVSERSRLLSFVRRRLFELSEFEAEDVLSDVLYNLLRRADVVGEVENLSAYVYRSLTNRITDYQRREMPEVAASEAPDPDFPWQLVLPPDPRPHPEERMHQAELRGRLFTAIGELTADERAIWIATEIDGIGFRELAEEWEEPIGTLLSRKSRATVKLRQKLSDYRDTR